MMGKVTVRDYNKSDGTHVRRYVRNDPRVRGSSSEEPNPEDEYNSKTEVNQKEVFDNTKGNEKPKGGTEDVI